MFSVPAFRLMRRTLRLGSVLKACRMLFLWTIATAPVSFAHIMSFFFSAKSQSSNIRVNWLNTRPLDPRGIRVIWGKNRHEKLVYCLFWSKRAIISLLMIFLKVCWFIFLWDSTLSKCYTMSETSQVRFRGYTLKPRKKAKSTEKVFFHV